MHELPSLIGFIDRATRTVISGWARDSLSPDIKISLLVTANERLLARVLADRLRPDLLAAGMGDGRYGFEVKLTGLSPFEPHIIAVRQERDGADLDKSPILLEPATHFDAEVQTLFAAMLADTTDDGSITKRLAFLAEQAENLLRLRSARRSSRTERAALRQIKWRWSGSAGDGLASLAPRALFIEEEVPRPTSDAGSNAVLSHMRALRRQGFEVEFAAANMTPDTENVLEAAGVACCHAPWHGSVEEILRREADSFALIYLHRASIAMRYLGLARFYQPHARLVYSVADLHYLRLARQARLDDRPELLALARRYQASELRSAAAADAVITHSTFEAALLRKQVPGVRVHVVPWSIRCAPTATAFAERRGVAFVGHYGHLPNLAAALWLTHEIMPQVRCRHPSMTCLLVGSDMPETLRRSAPGIEPVGQVDRLSEIFDRVRLTIAPMTYGAGIKGKVLESLAAGIPCVCTSIAAEGLGLPPLLRTLVADDVASLVAIIERLHEDEGFNHACGEAGLHYVATSLSEARIDALMRDVADMSPDQPGVSDVELRTVR